MSEDDTIPKQDALARRKQIEADERLTVIEQKRREGKKITEIADDLGVAARTVERDLALIRKRNVDYISEAKREEIVADAVAQWESLKAKLWDEFEAAESSAMRMKALDMIRVLEKDKLSAMKDAGMLTPKTGDSSESAKSTIAEILSPDVIQAVSVTILGELMPSDLADPVPDDALEAEIVETYGDEEE